MSLLLSSLYCQYLLVIFKVNYCCCWDCCYSWCCRHFLLIDTAGNQPRQPRSPIGCAFLPCTAISRRRLLGCPYTRLWRSLVDWHCCCLGIMSYLVQFQFPVTVLIEPDQLGKSIKGTGMFLILPHLFMIMGTKLWSELRSMDSLTVLLSSQPSLFPFHWR